MTDYSELLKRLRERPHRRAHETTVESQERRQKEREDVADALEAQATEIAELENKVTFEAAANLATAKLNANLLKRIAELDAALDGLSEAFVEEMVSAGWIMRDIESVPAFRAARAARAALKGEK